MRTRLFACLQARTGNFLHFDAENSEEREAQRLGRQNSSCDVNGLAVKEPTFLLMRQTGAVGRLTGAR